MNTKYLMLRLFSTLSLLASCQTGQPINQTVSTTEPLYFNGPISYEDESRIKPQVIAECEIEKNIIVGINERKNRNGLPITDRKSNRELTVEIVNATPGVFVFGNLGSIPATLDVSFNSD